MRVDLNADVGEGAPYDDELLRIVTTANVACGVHAGSQDLARATAEEARSRGLRVAAHPGYPGPAYGRLSRESLAELPENWLLSQLTLFRFDAVKPHGGLYHDLASGRHRELRPFFDGRPFIGLHAHQGLGSRLLREGFAERGYRSDGRLIPRGEPGYLIESPDLAARQALVLAPNVDTICIHGDSPNCVAIATAVRAALEAAGWRIGA